MSEWTSVNADDAISIADATTSNGPITSIAEWLTAAGLEKHCARIVDVTEAESVADFKLLDCAMVDEVISKCELKLISAEKFRRAVADLRGRAVEVATAAPAPADVSDRDSPDNMTAQAPPALEEAIAICIDRSGSMGAPLSEAQVNYVAKAVSERSRMEAVKAMFYAFRDRVDGLKPTGQASSSTQLGLLQFDNVVETLLDLTGDLDRFEAIVDDMKSRGQTAIFSAILDGAKMLAPVFKASPTADLRILVLTDGMSNSGAAPDAALAAVNSIGAVVDAIIVGDTPDANLRKMVAATGGLCFQISSLGEGFELLEGEGVASLKARRGGADKPPFVQRPPVAFSSLKDEAAFAKSAPATKAGGGGDLAKHKCVDLRTRMAAIDSAAAQGATSAEAGSAAVSGAGPTPGARRILKELRDVQSGSAAVWLHSGDAVHIFPSESDLSLWRVLIEGPAASPFAGGTFLLTVRIPAEYPLRPPSIRFETPVWHCNVNDGGSICLDILQSGWTPTLSVPKCLEAIWMMLKNPDTDNAMRQWIAEQTMSERADPSDTRYSEEAKRRTKADAAKSVAEWQSEWAAA